ncbi:MULTISPECIES: alpha-ribazole phosphatase [unclassified Burkholderia]|uniref:alpha-ribazole phosphatase n=1 Tax=unclassified Burkholderia TaxID=2613784 RepID=UPI000F58BF53|nr:MULTISPECIES: alpha-ribazole phosphatase [unclassified Burkholderia]RQR37747.1 alpha-ribazole phosphatase [Burkholderia sp. Bp9131]RQR68454.1 alpha-ribazole phosphatase [Burkholderia sp. Bp9015]RQR91828.1 alpha-ribazole phosphatase [Burkholderia sp. Bp8994]RQS29082.1 alpha-ribazole phosphatase [Burkholderia sp. Bp8995]RQS38556.1 alpha-ribazole phosphatase [Burkholderia sp. Bp8990]
MDLVLIRHPAVAVEQGVCYGRSDVPLAAPAEAGARTMRERLAALGAPLPAQVWTSPLTRCASVAERLAHAFDVPLRRDAGWQEMDFGAWELQRWDDIDRAALDAWAADLMHACAHGGESVARFVERVARVAGEVAQADAPQWAITHAGVIRAFASHALRVPLDTLLSRPVPTGGVVWLRMEDAARTWEVVHWDA